MPQNTIPVKAAMALHGPFCHTASATASIFLFISSCPGYPSRIKYRASVGIVSPFLSNTRYPDSISFRLRSSAVWKVHASTPPNISPLCKSNKTFPKRFCAPFGLLGISYSFIPSQISGRMRQSSPIFMTSAFRTPYSASF